MKKITLLFAALILTSFTATVNAQAWFPDSKWYQDLDADGFGNTSVSLTQATKPNGYVKNNIDCDDALSNVSAWGRVGKKGFTSARPINSNMDLAVGPTGTAYMIFIPTGSVPPTAMKKALGDSVWTVIDTVQFTRRSASSPTAAATECAIAVDSKDTVWAAVTRSGDLEVWRYHPSANSGRWIQIGADVQASASFIDIAIGQNDTVITTYMSGRRPRSEELDRPSTWSRTADGAGNEQILASNVDPVYMCMTTDKNGRAYVAYRSTAGGGINDDYQALVYRVNSNNNGWELVGGTIASTGTAAATMADSIKIAVDTSGVPYILYKDYNNSRKATVRRYNGSSWENVGSSGPSVGTITGGDIAVNRQTNEVYVAFCDSGADRKVVMLKYNGSSWDYVLSPSQSDTGVNVTLSISNGIPYVLYQHTSQSGLASCVRLGPDRIWTGNESTNWTNAKNWCGYDSPDSSEAVTFKTPTTFEPASPSGTTTFSSLVIQSSDTITVSSGSTFGAKGTFKNNGVIIGDGVVELRGSAAQTISGIGTISNLTLNNSNGAAIQSGSMVSVTGTYTPTAGTLTTNDSLVLKSNATGTGRIAAGTGSYISGNVIVERYIPGGRRAMRYFAHPFSTAQSLNVMTGTGELDITGTGGSANGFSPTSTNNPSSWWYDPATGDESTVTDPGWTPFTSANGTGVNTWNPYEGVKVLVRGPKGQGLTTTNYTPSPATFSMSGPINTGTQIVSVTKGAVSGYNLIGNPFPSQVDLSATTRGVNIENNFWVWNPSGGTKGIFESNPFTVLGTPVPYYLPSCAGFFVRTTFNSGNTITFTEATKVSNTPSSLFKTTATPTYVELRIEDTAKVLWDKYMLVIDSSGADTKEKMDAKKFFNAEMNFYSFSSQKDSLAIDCRPYKDSGVVYIDMWTALKKSFVINVANLGMPNGTKLILRDNYTNTDTVLAQGVKYPFTINNDSLSFSKRFELRFSGKPVAIDTGDTTEPVDTTTIIGEPGHKKLKIKLYPNPATQFINIDIDAPQSTPMIVNIYKINMNGIKVYHQSLAKMKNGVVQLPIANLPTGPYLVEIRSNNDRAVKHFVKH